MEKESIITDLKEQINEQKIKVDEYKVFTAGGIILALFFGVGIIYIVYRACQKHALTKKLEKLEDRLFQVRNNEKAEWSNKRVNVDF